MNYFYISYRSNTNRVIVIFEFSRTFQIYFALANRTKFSTQIFPRNRIYPHLGNADQTEIIFPHMLSEISKIDNF